MNDSSRLTAGRPMRPPLVRSYAQHIDAPPEAVFPLLCPVREGEWLEGWAAPLAFTGVGIAGAVVLRSGTKES